MSELELMPWNSDDVSRALKQSNVVIPLGLDQFRAFWLGSISATDPSKDGFIKTASQGRVLDLAKHSFLGVGDIIYAVLLVPTPSESATYVCLVLQSDSLDMKNSCIMLVPAEGDIKVKELVLPLNDDVDPVPERRSLWRMLGGLAGTAGRSRPDGVEPTK